MVSKASDDLPDPLRPVNTTSRSLGIESVTSFRLCSRAPRMVMWSMGMSGLAPGRYGQCNDERSRRRGHQPAVLAGHPAGGHAGTAARMEHCTNRLQRLADAAW